jgi:hypothetical protein
VGVKERCTPELKEAMRQLTDDYVKSREAKFHKMLMGV